MGASRFVGRVGGLAVALGVGAAVFSGGGVAWADTTDIGIGRDMCINEWVGRTVRANDSGTLLA